MSLFKTSNVLLIAAGRFDEYAQQAFEASRRFRESKTYPGAIRAATPGDTNTYLGYTHIHHGNERHYWRAVIDDPQVEYLMPLRIRFKDNVWVTSGWETRMHVVQVTVPRTSTIAQVIEQVIVDNQSPYLCSNPIGLSVEGKELPNAATIEECGLHEGSFIDAIDLPDDHLRHLATHRPKDWNVDELTEGDMACSPYKEMQPTATISLAPRYQASAQGYKGLRTYGPVRKDPQ